MQNTNSLVCLENKVGIGLGNDFLKSLVQKALGLFAQASVLFTDRKHCRSAGKPLASKIGRRKEKDEGTSEKKSPRSSSSSELQDTLGGLLLHV